MLRMAPTSRKYSVSVKEPIVTPVLTTITVSPSTAALLIGDTSGFTATALDQNDLPIEGINITWTSSDMAVGTVSPENVITGADGTVTTIFTAIAVGTAMVNATNGSVSGSADVTVSEEVVTPVLTTITVSPSTAALSIGDTPVFTATALDQNDLPMEGINITWTSSDMAVGTVSPENVITGADGTVTTIFTAIAVGTAMVNATNGSVSGSADVTVSEEVVTPVLTTITVSPSTAALSIGDTPVFTATALDQNDLPMEGINITWTSSDMAVGTVSPENAMTGADGKVTTTFMAIAMGTSIVNATNGSVVGSAEVVVHEEIEEINLIKNSCFESGRQNWIFYTNGTGKFNIISPGFEGNNAAEVKLGTIGSNIQLYYKGLTLKPNTHYRLSFAAKSSRGHDVEVVLLKHGSPYTNYGLKQNFNLTKDWQTFTTEFDTKRFTKTVDDGRLMFYLAPFAKAGDKYYFDSVVLEEET